MIYFDHAASSWPKPKGVIDKLSEFLLGNGANPGRGNYKMADDASKVIFQTRQRLASLFHIPDPNRIAFFMNTTQALNQALKGFLSEGDHVITSVAEHNSMRRPLEYLKKEVGIKVTYLPIDQNGRISPEQMENSIQSNTKLIAISHASNVIGSIHPIREIGQIAKNNQVKFLVDAAQTAGKYSIDVKEMNIHLLAFPGHKGLLGPQGIGGLYIDPEILLAPLFHGGTGNYSSEVDQPLTSPERYESGTLNTPGIVALGEAIKHLEEIGIDTIRKHEWELTRKLISGLTNIDGITVYGSDMDQERVAVIAFSVDGLSSNEFATILDQHYDIAVRSGFHCSPMIHQSLGTGDGAVRVSLGYTNTEKEVEIFLDAVNEIVSMMR